jgi:hypothetical protein
MKRIILMSLLAIVSALPSFAQYGRPYGTRRPSAYRSEQRYTSSRNRYGNETYYGLRLGLAVATVNSDDSSLDGGDASSGLNLGAVVGTQLSPYTPIYLEGGLFYVEKGGKGDYNNENFTYDLNYLEIPVVVKYKYYFNEDAAIQPFFGGFLSCGVGGNIKNYDKREATSSFSDDYFRRFDGGIRLGCGVSFQNFYMDLSYDIGLANICHDTFDKSHTGCFFATIGVDF